MQYKYALHTHTLLFNTYTYVYINKLIVYLYLFIIYFIVIGYNVIWIYTEYAHKLNIICFICI